jgi:hypothetical protein
VDENLRGIGPVPISVCFYLDNLEPGKHSMSREDSTRVTVQNQQIPLQAVDKWRQNHDHTRLSQYQ